jgi:uncharacterized protein (TIGR03000 family)
MMNRRRFAILAMTALAVAMLVPENSNAQYRFRRYGRVGGYTYSGIAIGVGTYRPYGYYGYRYGPYWGRDYDLAPYYGGTVYLTPSYVSPYYTPLPYTGSSVTMVTPGAPLTTQSFYPPDAQGRIPALVDVTVPATAQIWFDGESTSQTGPQRTFRSPPLEPGQNYNYEVKASWMQDGQQVERTQTVRVRAGERALVNFLTPSQGTGTPAGVSPDK